MRPSRQPLALFVRQARQVLVDQAGRVPGRAAEGVRAAAVDEFLLVLTVGVLDLAGVVRLGDRITGRLISRVCKDVNELLAAWLGDGFRPLSLPRATADVAALVKHLRSAPIRSVWRDPYNLGRAYQYFLEGDLEMFRNRGGGLVTEALLGPRTQQFTDRWIVEFLVHNTIGRVWLAMHPDSRLTRKLPYLVPTAEPTREDTARSVKDIKILDPACGTMNFAFPAFDLLSRMYREELAYAGQPGWPTRRPVDRPEDIPLAILTHNLFGVDLDYRPLVLAAVALFVHAGMPDGFKPNLAVADSLVRDTLWAGSPLLDARYDVILLNPPYLDNRDYSPSIRRVMRRNYPRSGRNLYSAFLERSLAMLKPSGRLGTITPQTFMFISSLEPMRRWLTHQATIESLVHTGLNTFDDATVDCAFYVLRAGVPQPSSDGHGHFFRLIDPTTPTAKAKSLREAIRRLQAVGNDADERVFRARQADFAQVPGSPWVYWITPDIRSVFQRLPSLAERGEIKQGLATTDNFRFVRFWWELGNGAVARTCRSLAQAQRTGRKWFAYAKSGGFNTWYSSPEYAVNWADDGREIKAEIVRRYPYLKGKWQWVAKNTGYYFRPGLSYSYLTSRRFSARIMPAGCIFDVAGSAVFADDPLLTLAVLNSGLCRFLLGLINATVNFQIGDLARLPVPTTSSARLDACVRRAVAIEKLMETFEETSPDFIAPAPWNGRAEICRRMEGELVAIEKEIDGEIYALYGLRGRDVSLIERAAGGSSREPSVDVAELAHRWVSYALGIVVGRFTPGRGKSVGCGIFRRTDFAIRPFVELSADQLPALLAEHDCQAYTDRHCAVHRFPRDAEQALARRQGGSYHGAVAIDVLAEAVGGGLEILLGPDHARQVIDAVEPRGLKRYLSFGFFKRHIRHYRNRPIYWVLDAPDRGEKHLLYYHRRDPHDWSSRLAEELGVERPSGPFTADIDDGVLLNMLPYRRHLADPQLRSRLDRHWRDLLAGRYPWSGLSKQLDTHKRRRQKGSASGPPPGPRPS